MTPSPTADPGADDTTPPDGTPTPDGRYLLFRGRRWRRTDPALEEDVIEALTAHLGRARSEVGRAKRAGDEDAVRHARDRVQLAKEGLGERGPTWWERPEEERRAQARDRLARIEAEAAPAPDSPGA